MGRFLPHPSDIPVELTLRDSPDISRHRLHTISLGGVACNYPRAWRHGTALNMRLPTVGPDACYPGFVAWCLKRKHGYLVGIAFTDEQTLFGARMIEQVCQIESYCRLQDRPENIELVALKWLEENAAEFSHDAVSRKFMQPLLD